VTPLQVVDGKALSAIVGILSAINRNHCPPSIGTPVRNHRNPQSVAVKGERHGRSLARLDVLIPRANWPLGVMRLSLAPQIART
jgi:hypothetical protein